MQALKLTEEMTAMESYPGPLSTSSTSPWGGYIADGSLESAVLIRE
jgi:hypothetical protein